MASIIQLDPRPELEARISACFEGGTRLRRELRLTPEEAHYLAAVCAAQVSPLGDAWYEITFQGAVNHGN
ncbi:MAG: hypothetical protein HFE97_00575 [Oscillospiraceae bacterium]|nr:hypothetical protein [Oscillospiraceae bacterium]